VSRRQWWQTPALRTDEEFDRARPVGWLELFFDLVFVVVIARLAHHLPANLDGSGVIEFVLQFVGVFWVWNAFTYYTERFESEGLENRLVTFLAIVPVAGLAIWGDAGLGEQYGGFAAAYLVARAVNMATWARAGLHNRIFRPVATRFLAGFAVVTAIILSSLTTTGNLRLALWAIAVVADIATPYFTLRHQAALPRLSTSKFPERFGLFTIIVLGEAVVGVITGLSELNDAGDLSVLGVVQGVVGLGIGFAIWWIYFDFVARRSPKPVITAALGWVYLHLAAVTAITMTGVGISVVIAEGAEGSSGDAGRILLVASVVLGLTAVALLETTLARGDDEPTHPRLSPGLKLVAAAVAAAAFIDLGWSPLSLLIVILAIAVVPCAYGAHAWFTQDLDPDADPDPATADQGEPARP